jgi:hypothetical protein
MTGLSRLVIEALDPGHGGEDGRPASRVGDEPGAEVGGSEGLGDEIGDSVDVAPPGADDGLGHHE